MLVCFSYGGLVLVSDRTYTSRFSVSDQYLILADLVFLSSNLRFVCQICANFDVKVYLIKSRVYRPV